MRNMWLSLSPLSVLAGLALVIWSYLSPVHDRDEFRFWRVLALLCGGLLSASPVLLFSWSLLEVAPIRSCLCFLAGMVLSLYLPLLCLRLFIWLGWLPSRADRAG